MDLSVRNVAAHTTKCGEGTLTLTAPQTIQIRRVGGEAETLLHDGPVKGKQWVVSLMLMIEETDIP